MKFSTSWFCVGNKKIEMFLTYDGHLGGFGGHFGHFLDHFGEPIQNKGVFCSKRKSPVLPCLGWGMTLMTWQDKNIKFWKNFVPFKHMFTVKTCVFWPFFCILKPMIGGQKKVIQTSLILNLTSKSNSCLQKWVYEALKSLWTLKKIFLNFEFRFFFRFFPFKMSIFELQKSVLWAPGRKFLWKIDAISCGWWPTAPISDLWVLLTAQDGPNPSKVTAILCYLTIY